MSQHMHEEIEELVAVRSLGGLDEGDLAHLDELMAAHGPSCEECQRIRDQYAEVAGRLAFAVAPEEIPAGMEDRVIQLAVRPPSRFGARTTRRLVAGIAAAVLLVAGGIGGYLLAPREGSPLQEANVTTLGGTGEGTVTLAVRPGSSKSFLIATGMEPAPAGHVYELWFFHGQTPEPAARFSPSGGAAVVQIPEDATGASLAAITVERAPGARAPTSKPIFAGPITTS